MLEVDSLLFGPCAQELRNENLIKVGSLSARLV